MADPKPGEVIFEYRPVGNSIRVTAVDAATGIEAVFQAPMSLGKGDLQRMALQKLAYVMRKKQEG